MAKKMVLVPASVLGKIGEDQSGNNKLMDLTTLLPKNYQKKGRIILEALQNVITINEQNRLVYKDGSVGSHIIDLIKYFITPSHIKIDCPPDARKFQKILFSTGIPPSILLRHKNDVSTPSWMNLQ